MNLPPSAPAHVLFRVEQLERDHANSRRRVETAEDLAQKHEVELHGERGVYSALRDLANEIKWTRRAMWGLAASLIVSSLTIAVALIPQ